MVYDVAMSDLEDDDLDEDFDENEEDDEEDDLNDEEDLEEDDDEDEDTPDAFDLKTKCQEFTSSNSSIPEWLQKDIVRYIAYYQVELPAAAEFFGLHVGKLIVWKRKYGTSAD